ncbi:uncharacterized protein LOC110343610 [Mesocricetus auratus]|uniref:Uncharacterized protein LOC110343610 n=1 Tax=Mesocricetus auratus TaxID=10036 RepID=A0ABM2XBG1_MESAU|nr:uncharacterized protein LOC110343610 [Mesocricetus auratus]
MMRGSASQVPRPGIPFYPSLSNIARTRRVPRSPSEMPSLREFAAQSAPAPEPASRTEWGVVVPLEDPKGHEAPGTSQDATRRCHPPVTSYLLFSPSVVPGPEPQAGVGYSHSAPTGTDPPRARSIRMNAAGWRRPGTRADASQSSSLAAPAASQLGLPQASRDMEIFMQFCSAVFIHSFREMDTCVSMEGNRLQLIGPSKLSFLWGVYRGVSGESGSSDTVWQL